MALNTMSLSQLNTLDLDDFVAVLGKVFEHSPWVPAQVWQSRPFTALSVLHDALFQRVLKASLAQQLALIRAHPQLADLSSTEVLTDNSKAEQGGAGLSSLSQAERIRFAQLNDEYQEKFGFPFIVAVKGLNKQQILERFARRLKCNYQQEFDQCLQEIGKIAKFRLQQLVTEE